MPGPTTEITLECQESTTKNWLNIPIKSLQLIDISPTKLTFVHEWWSIPAEHLVQTWQWSTKSYHCYSHWVHISISVSSCAQVTRWLAAPSVLMDNPFGQSTASIHAERKCTAQCFCVKPVLTVIDFTNGCCHWEYLAVMENWRKMGERSGGMHNNI